MYMYMYASWRLHKPLGIYMGDVILSVIYFSTWFLLILAASNLMVGKWLNRVLGMRFYNTTRYKPTPSFRRNCS